MMIVKKISAREGLFSMLTNYHTHTTRCGHAEGTEEEYILTALRCGYKVLGFSDHTPWAYATPGFVSHIRMLPAQLDDYVLTLRSLREKYADRLHLHIGLEAEYFPAYLGWLKEETERLGIEYLILGCHYDTTDEQDAKARRFGGSASPAHGRRYAEQVERALETGLYRYLAHPDLFLNRMTAFDAEAEKACREVCAAAARLDIPLEYNMAGLTARWATPGTSSGASRRSIRSGPSWAATPTPPRSWTSSLSSRRRGPFCRGLASRCWTPCRGWNEKPLHRRAASAILG